MHTALLRRIAALPVIREALGAGAGVAIALAAYTAFEFGRAHLDPQSVGVAVVLALAAGCAYMQRRMVSRVA